MAFIVKNAIWGPRYRTNVCKPDPAWKLNNRRWYYTLCFLYQACYEFIQGKIMVSMLKDITGEMLFLVTNTNVMTTRKQLFLCFNSLHNQKVRCRNNDSYDLPRPIEDATPRATHHNTNWKYLRSSSTCCRNMASTCILYSHRQFKQNRWEEWQHQYEISQLTIRRLWMIFLGIRLICNLTTESKEL